MLLLNILTAANVIPVMQGILDAISPQSIGIATAVVGGVGLFIGLFLGFSAKKFEVEVDEKETRVRELLPGANCGGCGYAGCDALANAIAEGKAPVNACPVANTEVHSLIAEVMGTTAEAAEKKMAYVKCAGTCEKAQDNYEYFGVMDCKKAALVPGNGGKKCSFGCMGYGSCVKVCAFDAIHIVEGIAVVDKEKCTGCTKCTAECPNHLIDMVPAKSTVLVRCDSKDKGKDVKASCTIGCIGCKLCTRACEYDAIHVNDNLALIDYEKCTNCGKCAAVCPVKVIELNNI